VDNRDEEAMPEVATHATIIQRLAKTAQDGSDNEVFSATVTRAFVA
jgi:hypothetical protein